MSAVLVWLTIVLASTGHPWAALTAIALAYLLNASHLRRLRRLVARPGRAAGPQNRPRLPGAIASTSRGSLGPAFALYERRRSH